MTCVSAHEHETAAVPSENKLKTMNNQSKHATAGTPRMYHATALAWLTFRDCDIFWLH
jgi:hypothetical protein